MMRIAHVVGLTLIASLGVTSCGVNDAATAGSALDEAGGKGSVPVPADPAAIRPFKINVPQPVLDDLKERLARTRLKPRTSRGSSTAISNPRTSESAPTGR